MKALTRTPLSEQAAQALLEAIGDGRWEIGDQLPGEVALAEELSVGRSTIREAIRHLAARGVLTTRAGVGVFLAAREPVEPWDRLAQIGEITDVVQVRVAIESRAAGLAAHQHDDDDARAIRLALGERNALVSAAPADLAAADIRLHRAIVAASHNSLLLALFDSLRQRLIGAMTDLLTIMPAIENDVDDHVAVVDAITTRDADTAERLTREHLLGLAEALRRNS
ncbi:FadR/GntR family transcriptional regulator [Rhodococcus sp. NPDC003318]|uniref:FadR/GntR family transcriptional regulator n=1 Tax=Rhodococcus sp. NPDC003318 TaxID=3364503 RepID=UPI0036863811